MESPSGEQYQISGGGYTAVVTETGAGLRSLRYGDRDLVDGYAEDAMAFSGRGQWLIPWPNRIRDGAYRFDGRDLQLALSEPDRHNASHGLVRWTSWRLLDRRDDAVELGYRLAAQSGYPWSLELSIGYRIDDDGLHVRHRAVNRAATAAPYAAGMHPYLRVGTGPVDDWELTLPATTRAILDDRMLPIGREPVAGTGYDFTRPRAIGDLVLDDAFTDLQRDDDGWATVVVRRGDHEVRLRVDGRHHWLQVFSADPPSAGGRRALAVEPMTAPADAFRSGDDLVVLEPGQAFSAEFRIG